MQFPTSTTLLFSLLLAVIKAQNLGAEPPCATACLSSAIVAAGCALTDEACQCGPTQAAIGAKAEPCLLESCGATQIGAVESIGLALCAAYSSSMSITMAPNTTGSTSSTGMPSSGTGSGSKTTSESTTSSASGAGTGGTSSAPSAGSAPSGSSTSKAGAAKITGVAYAGAAVLGFVGAMVAL